ncbi:hypothetical protein AN958_09404 [Leucoagaricus sp. SymC.cos]|nr:hypothetical protein AN958_09404 [Leucoagaricus sp. SymC.cos]
MSFIRLPDDAPSFKKQHNLDPSGGTASAHIESTFARINAADPASGSIKTTPAVHIICLHAISRGSVTITSSNPFDYPAIAPLRGSPSVRRLLSAPAFHGSFFDSTILSANVTCDKYLEAFLRNGAAAWSHPVGSVLISPRGTKWGVVAPEFRVARTELSTVQ